MKVFRAIAQLLMWIGIAIFLCGIAFGSFIKDTKDGRALAAKWLISAIFNKYGHTFTWDSVLYKNLHPHLKTEVEKARKVGFNTTQNDALSAGRHISRTTHFHVVKILNVPPWDPLFLFLFELINFSKCVLPYSFKAIYWTIIFFLPILSI